MLFTFVENEIRYKHANYDDLLMEINHKFKSKFKLLHIFYLIYSRNEQQKIKILRNSYDH
jgi:hypothetical protein